MKTKAEKRVANEELAGDALTEAQRKSIRTHRLTERGLLLKVKASRFNNKRIDRGATEQLCTEKGATSSAAQVSKVLVSKQHLSPVTTEYNRIREVIRNDCLPWDGTGWVFVPIGVYQKVRAALSAAIAAKDEAVEKVAAEWESVINEQRALLGDLFNYEDYPNPDEFRQAWQTEVDVQAIPSTDIRLDMDDASVNDIADQVAGMVKKNMAGAWEEAMTRLSDGLSNASTILNDKGTDSKRRAPVHDSLLENLRTQAGIVRAMGQTLDKPDMVKLATRVEQELLRFSAATLRANPDVRDRIGKKCAEVSNKAKLEAHTTAKRMDEMMDEMEDFI